MGTAQAFDFDRELESLVRPIFRPATVGMRGPFAYRVGHPNSRLRHEIFVYRQISVNQRILVV